MVQHGHGPLEVVAGGGRHAAALGRGNQPGLAQVVFRLEVLDLGLVGSVHHPNRNRKDRVALIRQYHHPHKRKLTYRRLFTNGIVDHIVVGRDLLFRCVLQVLHARAHLLQVNIAQAPIEQHLTGEQPELQAQLLVVDGSVAPEVEQRVIEISQCLLKVPQKEVGHSLLEVGNSQVLIQANSPLVAINLFLVSNVRADGRVSYSSFMLS